MNKYIDLRYINKLILVAACLTLVWESLFPQHAALASTVQAGLLWNDIFTSPEVNTFPVVGGKAPRYSVKVTVTAYSSTLDQTDSTPFVTASGKMVHRGVVAANWLPLGTKIRIPDYYGDEVFTVEDRMNVRFSQRMDIWMPTRDDAKAWGAKHIMVEVL